MLLLVYLTSFLLLKKTSAQILSLGQAGNVNANLQRTVNLPTNNVVLANNGISGLNSLPFNSLPVPNVQLARSTPVSAVVANNNFGAANLVTSNLATNNFAVPAFGNNLAGGVSANLVNNNLGGGFVAQNIGSNFVNANLPINLANGFNINTGTFAVSNNGLASLLPYGRPCGIQIAADALEVGGSVGVNGQMPFYATVNVNGNLPTSGSGIVNCGCA